MPVQILNETPLAIGFMSGRVHKNGHHLTVIVKGVFALAPGKLAFAPERPLLEGDVHWDDDAPSSCRHASDFAPFKPRADVTVVGTCHLPRGQAAGRAALRFGALKKTLLVHGDRQFIPRGSGYDISQPLPLRSLPLRYERAFGGEGHSANPLGKGLSSADASTKPLPNIELPSAPIRTPDDRPEPAGFGPLDRRWSQRASKLGTYDRRWLAERWPYFPDDFDWGYFNAAPADQQLPYLRGDEAFSIEGMHAELARVEGELPGIRPRCFVRSQRDGGEVTEEALLQLDTAAIDVDAAAVTLVWRGLIPVRTREYEEVTKTLLVVESLADEPKPGGHYLEPSLWNVSAPSQEELGAAEDAAARGAPVEMPEPPPARQELDPEEQAELAEARRELETAGADPALLDRLKGVTSAAAFSAILFASMPQASEEEQKAEELEKATQSTAAAEPPKSPGAARRASDKKELDAMRAELAAGKADPALVKKLEGEQTKRGFLGVLFGDLPPPTTPEEERERKEILAFVASTEEAEEAAELAEEAKPRIARGERLTREEVLALAKSNASLSEANLTELDLSGADLRGVDLSFAKLGSAKLVGANLTGADLTGATLRLADLAEAVLSAVVATDASFEEARLVRANLGEASLARAVFTGAKLEEAVLDHADLTSTKLDGAVLSRASLTAARFDEADLRGADLRGARGAKASFRKARLVEAWLEGAKLDGAILIECELTKATLDGASLREAHFQGAMGADASFRGADLTNVRAEGAHFAGGRFAKILAEKSNWSGAELTGADFEGAGLGAANFTGAQLSLASFTLARLEEAHFTKAHLASAKLSRANLFRARFGGADLTGADCRASNLFECDLFEANTTSARFERANLKRTLLDRSRE